MLTFPPLNPRPRKRTDRKPRPAPQPPALEVLVTSVVALGDGSARITFNLPVTLNEFGPDNTIRFVVGGVTGYAEDLSQSGPDSIDSNAPPGLPITAGSAWTILALPPCFVLPAGATMPVPQSGTVE